MQFNIFKETSLSKHLVLTHGYSSLRARELACRALPGDIHIDGGLDDVSDDDSVFDLFDETERLRAQEKSINNFELDYLDDISNDLEVDNNVDAARTVVEKSVENYIDLVLNEVNMDNYLDKTGAEANGNEVINSGLENMLDETSDVEENVIHGEINDKNETEESVMENRNKDNNDKDDSEDYTIISDCESADEFGVDSFSSGGSINSDSLIDSDNAVTDGDGLVNGGDTATGSDGSVIGDDAEISCASSINGDGSFNTDDDGDMDSDSVINISSDD